ncbi:MAG: LpxI family protein [Pedosphaera sp.]|nr:LpxI family protein [Pedosphaera sp.]
MIGLIAGSKSLPFLFARQARQLGEKIVAVAFEGETDPALASLVDEIVWTRVGQLSKMIRAFTDRDVTRCVMLGQIVPKNLFDLRPDLRSMGLLMRLREKNAHTLFSAIGDELATEGVTLIPAVPWLVPWMPSVGYSAGAALRQSVSDDLLLGLKIAKEVSRLEIGQLVVVKEGTVLAVEGFEGTDACLERGGQLAGKNGGAVAVKVAREGHDMRFDIPCIGPKTLEVCAAHGVSTLAFESDKTLLIDRPDLEKQAARLRIALVSC